MVLSIETGRLEVYKVGNNTTTPDLTITPPKLRSVTIEQEVQDAAGKAGISIKNKGGEFAGEITAGDRLEFVVQLGGIGNTASTTYGGGTYGGGSYGVREGDVRMWTGMAQVPRYSFNGPGTRMIELEAQPYAFAIMGTLGRKVDNAFRNKTVTEIATTILGNEAEELDTSGIESFTTTYDVEFDGTPLLKAMKELADVVNAVLTANGTTVVLKPLGNIPILWTASGDDFLSWDVDPLDNELYNQVRVEGGTDNDVGDSQLTQSAYTTVTETSRITHRMNMPKSRIDQVDLWTQTTGSQEDLIVRIQEDKGGSPTDPTDQTKDLVNKTLSHEFLSGDDFTTFLLELTILPDTEPWLIVESEGSSGQNVGVNGSGVPAFQSFYFYPIITQDQNEASVDKYLRREHRIERDNITTAQAASDLVQSTLDHHNEPRKQFSGNTDSLRGHRLEPTDAIRLEYEEETAVGEYMVTHRSDTYAPDGSKQQLTTDLKLEEIATF